MDRYERCILRLEVLREALSTLSAKAYDIETEEAENLGNEIYDFAENLLTEDYESDERFNEAEEKFKEYQTRVNQLIG